MLLTEDKTEFQWIFTEDRVRSELQAVIYRNGRNNADYFIVEFVHLWNFEIDCDILTLKYYKTSISMSTKLNNNLKLSFYR